ncbi:hypothetical protein VTN31DRAFT_2226 [Thermomyces dupontii]|uniref:uncharacterized protein n=1 Tax=Talaromyces thermophilus TaxID=28565 RepID=UPI0037433556
MASLAKSRCRWAIAFVLAACLILIASPYGRRVEIGSSFPAQSVLGPTPPEKVECHVDTNILHTYNLQEPVHYVRREIQAKWTMDDLPMSMDVDMALLNVSSAESSSDFNETDVGWNVTCAPPIQLRVPRPPPKVDASHLDFAISTTGVRLLEAMNAFGHWLGHSNARMLAVIKPGADLLAIERKANSLGINLVIIESDKDYETRYWSLVKVLADNARPETKWSVVMDDDTFFPSMTGLVDMLAQYDETQPYYIGALSENAKQIGIFGVFAFGGAGIFISRPLLTELGEVWDGCQEHTEHGDGKIAWCIYQLTDTKLTIDPGLYQMDLPGDASGFFEAGRKLPISLHHWRSWFWADMAKISSVSRACGTSCILRQWRFADDWILTNGYSVIQYSDQYNEEIAKSKGKGPRPMEKTWDDMNGSNDQSFYFRLAPLRPKDPGKVSYKLEDTIVEDDGSVRQIYVLRAPRDENGQKQATEQEAVTLQNDRQGDRVIELIWRPVQ